MKRICVVLLLGLVTMTACNKDRNEDKLNPDWRYFQVGMRGDTENWKDSTFIVATSDPAILAKVEAQLMLSPEKRQMVTGELIKGSGGYNTNASHEFKWHFKEDTWSFADVSAEIYDGRPHSDLDLHLAYWLDTLGRYAPWGSFIVKEIPAPVNE